MLRRVSGWEARSWRRPVRRLLPALLAASVGAGMGLAGPPGGGDRSRTIKGWQVEDVSEQDGGRLVQLSRATQGLRLQYSAAFWRGNGGRIQSTLVERSDCTTGETLDREALADAKAVRALLTAHLAECAVPPRRIEAALRGFEPAYRLAQAWARDADAATAAEAAAIAGQGRKAEEAMPDGPDTVPNAAGATSSTSASTPTRSSNITTRPCRRRAPRQPISARCAAPNSAR